MKENLYNREEMLRELEQKNSGKSKNLNVKEISSDFKLLYTLLKRLLIFIIKIPLQILQIIIYLLSGKTLEFKKVLGAIINEPFKIIGEIIHWFFQGKWTANLIIFIIFCYGLEFLLVIPNGWFESLAFSSKDLFSGEFWSVLTSVFLHANISHILGNLVALLVFGRIVERSVGAKMVLIFLGSAIIANIISGLIYYSAGDFTPSVGASGGIAGLIIFAILIEPFAVSSILIFPIPILFLGWFLISLDLMGITNSNGNTNHLAHLGGYLALLIIFFFLELKYRQKILVGFLINLLVLVIVYFLISFFGINLSGLSLT